MRPRISLRGSVGPSVGPLVHPLRLFIFDDIDVLISTAWPVLTLVNLRFEFYRSKLVNIGGLGMKNVISVNS